MTVDDRPVPVVGIDDEAFWRSGADGILAIHRCASCRRWAHPPSPVCASCHSRAMVPEAATGTGRVHTFTINHQPWFATIPPPYVIAVVELDEQPDLRVLTRLVGCDPDQVHIGQRVAVTFEDVGGVWLPLFCPSTGRP